MNSVKRLALFNAGRDPERLALKYQKMRASPFAFLRGSCHLFYERLTQGPRLPTTPLVWACGDLHLENFGSYQGDNRQVYFDINDFDEAALAPASWDLVRMLASLDVGLRDAGVKKAQVTFLSGAFITAYADALTAGKAYWLERDTAQGPVRQLLDTLRERKRAQFLDSRTERAGERRRIRIDGKKALAATAAQRQWVKALLARFAKQQGDKKFYRVMDVARRIAGTGSLGLERYVVLIDGKGGSDGQYLLDLKLAPRSSLEPLLRSHLRLKQPRWPDQARRIVELQTRLQAVPMAFLHAVQTDAGAYVLRALQASEDRIAIAASGMTADGLHLLVHNMGQMLAWAHLRSAGRQGSADADALIDFGPKRAWRAKLLVAARACAAQARKDAAAFNTAYDAGELRDD
jgi:uncharacterized protein (DUF2252 family)